MIRVGQVTVAYGTDGAVKVFPLTDFDDRFSRGAKVLLDGAEREVEWSRPGQPGLVVKLRGIDTAGNPLEFKWSFVISGS